MHQLNKTITHTLCFCRFSDLHAKGQTAKDIDDDSSNDPDCLIRALPIVLQYYGKNHTRIHVHTVSVK